jgi:hypothetical protein
MDWLKKRHAIGEEHVHLRPDSPEAMESLEQWRAEEAGNP